MKSSFQTGVTVVANEFLDRYMASANGEYVKVYLYILRHQSHAVTVELIADALNHTEADVRRAIAYWVKLGALELQREDLPPAPVQKALFRAESSSREAAAETVAAASPVPGPISVSGSACPVPGPVSVSGSASPVPGRVSVSGAVSPVSEAVSVPGAVSVSSAVSSAPAAISPASIADKKMPKPRPYYTPIQVSKLAQEEDFTQLLYIAQKYMNKVFTPRECEMFAYLYDGLHMSVELLEYLVEYCVQSGHSNIRYMEAVALNWHEKGYITVEQAKAYTVSYTKDIFSVMKAFGLSDRKPGEAESEIIRRWFKDYGFTKEVVVEACGRTLAAIHNPSFQYADKILTEWKKAGVRHINDIKALDEKRGGKSSRRPAAKNSKNQFHNFEQRDTNYEALMLERLKERMGEQ